MHGRAQHVTRHGKPAVVVLAETDYIACSAMPPLKRPASWRIY
jgi:PHD/YefM family antitoxin component YafN of YafNO toxin-antitoxin module